MTITDAHPANPANGYQTVTAFGVLADVSNGYPTFLAEMTLLTTLRTAATSAMTAKRLAREDSSMALIGAGSQAEFQALAFRTALGIDALSVLDIDPAAVQKFRRNMDPLGFEITVVDSVAEATVQADIVTTCTADKAQNTIRTAGDVRPGVQINAVGGDCPGKTEIEKCLVDRSRVFVEFPPQTCVEGEIQQMDPLFPVTEFWKVLTGRGSRPDLGR